MKLEKREITLNETDSLKDMFFWEKFLSGEYKEGAKRAERKETKSELIRLCEEAQADMEFIQERLQRSEKSSVFSKQ